MLYFPHTQPLRSYIYIKWNYSWVQILGQGCLNKVAHKGTDRQDKVRPASPPQISPPDSRETKVMVHLVNL